MDICVYDLLPKDNHDIKFKISSCYTCCNPFDNIFLPGITASYTVVAYVSDKAAGKISFRLHGKDSPAELEDLFVDCEFQGQGLASKLLEIMHRMLYVSGVKEVYGHYGPKKQTETNAFKMYQKHGYEFGFDGIPGHSFDLSRIVKRQVDDSIRMVDEEKDFTIKRNYEHKMTKQAQKEYRKAEFDLSDWEKACTQDINF